MKSILRKHFNKSVLHIAFFAMCFTALWLGSNMTASAATQVNVEEGADYIKISDDECSIWLTYYEDNPTLVIEGNTDVTTDVINVLERYVVNNNYYTIAKMIVNNSSTPNTIDVTVARTDYSNIATNIIKISSDESFDLGVESNGSIQILSKYQQSVEEDVPSDNLNVESNLSGIDYISKNTKVTVVNTASFESISNIVKSEITIKMRHNGDYVNVPLNEIISSYNSVECEVNVTLDSSISTYSYVAPAELQVTESIPILNLNGSAAFKNGSFIVDNVSDSRTQSISIPTKVMKTYSITKPSISGQKINITTQTTVDDIGNYVKTCISTNTLGLNYADVYFLTDGANEPTNMFFDISSGSLTNFRIAKIATQTPVSLSVDDSNSQQITGSTYSKYKVANPSSATLDGSSYEVSYVKNTSGTSGQMRYYNLKDINDNSTIKLLLVSTPNNGYLDYIKLDGNLTKFEGSVPDATLKEAFMNKAIQTVDATSNNVYSYIHYTYEPVALTINDSAVDIANSGVKIYFYNKNKVYVESNDYEFLYEKTETGDTITTEGIFEIDNSGKNKADSFELTVKNSTTGEEITVSFETVVEITAVDIGNYQDTKTADDSLTWLEYSNDGVFIGMYADSENIDVAKAIFSKSYDLDLFKAYTDENGAIVLDDDGNITTDFSEANLKSFIHYFVLSGDYGDYSHTNTLSMSCTLADLKKYAINVESALNGSITTYTFTYPSVFGISYTASVDESGNITKLIETSGGDTHEIDLSNGSISESTTVEKTEGGMNGNEATKSESSTTKKNEQNVPETTKTTKHTITVHVTMNGKENTFTVSVDDGSALPSIKTLAAKKYNLDAELLEITTKDLPKLITSDLDVYVKVTVPETTSDEKEGKESGININSNEEDVIISFVDADGTIIKTTVVKSGTNVNKLAPDGYDWNLKEDTVAYHDMTIYAGKIAASKLDKSYNTKNDY